METPTSQHRRMNQQAKEHNRTTQHNIIFGHLTMHNKSHTFSVHFHGSDTYLLMLLHSCNPFLFSLWLCLVLPNLCDLPQLSFFCFPFFLSKCVFSALYELYFWNGIFSPLRVSCPLCQSPPLFQMVWPLFLPCQFPLSLIFCAGFRKGPKVRCRLAFAIPPALPRSDTPPHHFLSHAKSQKCREGAPLTFILLFLIFIIFTFFIFFQKV